MILTTACPDTTGVVAAVAGFLASHQLSDHRGAALRRLRSRSPRSCAPCSMTTARVRRRCSSSTKSSPAASAQRFGMKWRFDEARRKCRVVLAVSKHGHCLNSMLHRWSTGTLPIEVVAVVSNHQDMRSLTEWHGVPYHYLPVLDGRKVEQERRMIELFEKVDGELLVLARYMQILTPGGVRVFRRPRDQHSSFVSAGLQRREGLSPGAHPRREADRRDRALRDDGSRRRSDHRAGSGARGSHHDARRAGEHRRRSGKRGAEPRREVARRASRVRQWQPRQWC